VWGGWEKVGGGVRVWECGGSLDTTPGAGGSRQWTRSVGGLGERERERERK